MPNIEQANKWIKKLITENHCDNELFAHAAASYLRGLLRRGVVLAAVALLFVAPMPTTHTGTSGAVVAFGTYKGPGGPPDPGPVG